MRRLPQLPEYSALLGNAGKIRDVAAKYGPKAVELQAKQPGWAAQ
jgi:hypothetical protein